MAYPNINRHIAKLSHPSIGGFSLRRKFEELDVYSVGQINLFVGPNGAGKSTILNTIGSINNPTLFASLRRHVIPEGYRCTFRIELHNGLGISIDLNEAYNADEKNNFTNTLVRVQLDDPDGQHLLHDMPAKSIIGEATADTRKWKNIAPALEAMNLHIEWITPSFNDLKRYGDKIGDELNSLKEQLFGLDSYRRLDKIDDSDAARAPALIPTIYYAGGHINFLLSDDPGFPNQLKLERIPSGWQMAAWVLCGLNAAPDDSICLIEEPEAHLHPALQRTLANRISQVADKKGLQIFIATHSPTFLQREVWGKLKPSVFAVDGRNVKPNFLTAGLLDTLGVRASDLLQTNGVIWVEGPSDRLYIKAFLENFAPTCNELQGREHIFKEDFEENKHYSFLFYGGSCLSHFRSDPSKSDEDENSHETDELIDILKVNKNAGLFVDRDSDFSIDDFGDAYALNGYGRTKVRLIEALLANGNAMAHVTSGYTIEDYLPANWKRQYLTHSAGRTTVNTNKTVLARKFAETPSAVASALQTPELRTAIVKLKECLFRWNVGA
ncbi:ATP-dependent nuclease [Burkholderia vietnamiensis]|uniref:ATP-dependent nuclease n=1 Tax=Burkholderia vietnamiensis TaxID=60552 RepID=UPI0009C0C606|nr:AAA family ATPase [Burkholderia vietnamiensis]